MSVPLKYSPPFQFTSVERVHDNDIKEKKKLINTSLFISICVFISKLNY